jgi:hypothetical protein
MPLVAPISRLLITNQAPVRRSAAGLSGLAGLMAFAVLVVMTSVNWSNPDATGIDGSVEEIVEAPTGLGSEPSRLLIAHKNLNSFGLLHGQLVQDQSF